MIVIIIMVQELYPNYIRNNNGNFNTRNKTKANLISVTKQWKIISNKMIVNYNNGSRIIFKLYL